MHSALAGLVVVAAVAAVPAPALPWGPPVTLAPPAEVRGPEMAAYPASGAVVAWERVQPGREPRVVAVRVTGEGVVGPVTVLSAPDVDTAPPYTARVGAGAVVAWTQSRSAFRPDTATEVVFADLASAAIVERVPGVDGRYLAAVAGGADGTVAFAAVAADRDDRRIVVVVRSADGTWQAPVAVGGTIAPPALAVGADGTVAVMGDDRVAWVRTPAGVWSRSRPLSRQTEVGDLIEVTVASDGSVVALWQERRARPAHPDGVEVTLQAAHRPAGGVFGAARVVARGYGGLRLAGGDGGPAVAWRQRGRGVLVTRRPIGGSWSRPERVPGTAGLCREAAPEVLLDTGGGGTLLGWTVLGTTWTVRRRPSGGWGRPVPAARTAGSPFVAAVADGSGTAVLAWNADYRFGPGDRVSLVVRAAVARGAAQETGIARPGSGQFVRAVDARRVGGGRVRVRYRLARAARVAVRLPSGAVVVRAGRPGVNVATLPSVRREGEFVGVRALTQRGCEVEAVVRRRR